MDASAAHKASTFRSYLCKKSPQINKNPGPAVKALFCYHANFRCHTGSDHMNISCHFSRYSLPSLMYSPSHRLLPTYPLSPPLTSLLSSFFIESHLGSARTRFSYQVNEYLYHRGRSQDAQGAGENNHTEQTVLGKQRGTQ